jgi:hypothetical protein
LHENRRLTCETVNLVDPPTFLSFSSRSLSLAHTDKGSLPHLLVNCDKMERLLDELWVHFRWPITSCRKGPQCRVFWNVEHAKCCRNKCTAQCVCLTKCLESNSALMDGTVTFPWLQNKSKLLQFGTVYSKLSHVLSECSFVAVFKSVPRLSREIPHWTIWKVGLTVKTLHTYLWIASILSTVLCLRNVNS